jgi:hypothetical protein
MNALVRFWLLLLLGAGLVGCANIERHNAVPGRNFKDVRRFFVLRNLKDNHGIEERLVRALRARGFEVESGPETLQPATAQVVIGYEDRWAWDFSDHMVMLKLSARDPRAAFPYASVTYVKHVAFSTDAEAVVGQVLGELLASGGEPKKGKR